MADQFSLCWDNFYSNMSSELSSLLKSENLVDVTLAAEGRYLKAHKMVLSVCSPYFKELFQINPCQHPIVFLKDVSYSVLSDLIQFMYRGEVKVSQDQLATFIKTAEALKIKGLTADGVPQNDPQPTSQTNIITTEEVTNRKSVREREKSPPVRKKPMGPASKRIKIDQESEPSTSKSKSLPCHQPQQPPSPQNQQSPQQQSHMSSKSESEISVQPVIHFKLEPEETAVSLVNEEDIPYDDTAMDDIGMDNSTDYLMESATQSETSAGTSTIDNVEATSDNQGMYKFVVTQLGTLNLVLHQHLYRPRSVVSGKRLWNCTWKKHCPAKCISSNEKLVGKKGMHSHPPQRQLIAAKESAGQVVYRKLF